MKIAVRCLYYRPITPNFLIINLEGDDFSAFLWGDNQQRIRIVAPFYPQPHPQVREILWIPLDKLSEPDKATLIANIP